MMGELWLERLGQPRSRLPSLFARRRSILFPGESRGDRPAGDGFLGRLERCLLRRFLERKMRLQGRWFLRRGGRGSRVARLDQSFAEPPYRRLGTIAAAADRQIRPLTFPATLRVIPVALALVSPLLERLVEPRQFRLHRSRRRVDLEIRVTPGIV
jgi:hypothetical protein